jgi:AraC-like DNA-binding protein
MDCDYLDRFEELLVPKRQVQPPQFVMWKSIPGYQQLGWERHWFGNELNPAAIFNVRGLGLREPMFNANVHRPAGTGDWLIMFFHKPARLRREPSSSRSPAKTLILWPPGAEQFYSWGRSANVEPHSWIHVEGTWVNQQVEENRLATNTPMTLDEETIVQDLIHGLIKEMTRNEQPDPVILQNLFQNWARSVSRALSARDPQRSIPHDLLLVRNWLNDHFTERPDLDALARIANMSRSYLCHQFRRHFNTTISGYMIRKRMSTAQRLLYDPGMRPCDIAETVGYPDVFQFSKQFKKTFGVSPTTYRKLHSSR